MINEEIRNETNLSDINTFRESCLDLAGQCDKTWLLFQNTFGDGYDESQQHPVEPKEAEVYEALCDWKRLATEFSDICLDVEDHLEPSRANER